MAQFKVSGELTLGNQQFVGAARESKTALEGVAQGGAKLVDTSRAVVAATTTVTESVSREARAAKDAQVAIAGLEQASTKLAAANSNVAVNVAAQAAGFARLAEQRAAETAKVQSAQTMAAVEQSTQSLAALYGGATVRVAESAKKAADVQEAANRKVTVSNVEAARSTEALTGRLTTLQKTQLGFQINDVFTSLVGGMNPLMIAAQQGPQITQVFGGIGNTLRMIPPAAAAAALAIGLVAGAASLVVGRGAELTAQNRALEVSLVATGRAAQVTSGQLQQLVLVEAQRAGAGRDETLKAAQQLLGNNQLAGQQVQQTLALARDLARITGSDLPTAAQALSAGLTGTVDGARKLDAAFNVLTPRELEQIRSFELMGEKGAAVSVVINALQRNLGGANERGLSPFLQSTNELNAALGRLADTAASSKVAGFLERLPGRLAEGTARFVDRVSGAGPGTTPAVAPPATADLVAAQRQGLEQYRQRLAELQAEARQSPGTVRSGQINREILQTEARIREAEVKVQSLERQAGAVAASAVEGQATAESNRLKDSVAVVDRYTTVIAERQKLHAELAQAQKVIDSPLADPQQVARAREVFTQIEGRLYALKTPAEEARQALDLTGALATLPPHLQAAEREAQATYRRFREMGQSEAQALAAADQARANALASQSTATREQIEQLSAETQAALRVADAYGTSRAAALRLQAEAKAAAAEEQGQIAPGTAGALAQQTLEQNAATAVAAAAEKVEAYGREVAALERLVDAEGRGSAAARETARANQVATLAEDLRAQAAASGSAAIVAAAERRIAAYDRLSQRELAANVRREAQALNAQYDPSVAYDLEIRKLEELKATGILTARTVEDYTRQAEQRRLEASRSATDGMIAGLRRYADESANAGQIAADGVMRGLKSAEDQLVSFVTTGKFTITDFTNSIIADLARIAIQKAITGPLARGIGSILDGLGSAITGGGGFNPAANSYGGGSAATGYFHDGGIVGRGGLRGPALPDWVWAAAPRFHRGGIAGLGPNERPIVALDDEEVITRSDPRHRWNMGAGGGYGGGPAPSVTLNLINNSGTPLEHEQGAMTGNGNGGFTLDVLVNAVDDRMAQRANAGSGKFLGALQGGYGVRKVPRR